MKNLLILCFIIVSNAYSQPFDQDVARSYEVELLENPQTVRLFEMRNGDYRGELITQVFKGKYNHGRIIYAWRKIWNIKSQQINDTLILDPKTVNILMTTLEEKGIETIEDCRENKECHEQIFLDGGSVLFKIKTDLIDRDYGFQAIYPITYGNQEVIELRYKAQLLITELYNHVDLNNEFSDLFKRIPSGYYHWHPSAIYTAQIRNNRTEK